MMKLYFGCAELLIADVGGGYLIYLRSFFPVNGVHALNSANPQFHEMLQLFLQLERLWINLQQSLDVLKDYLEVFADDENALTHSEIKGLTDDSVDILQGNLDTMRREFETTRVDRNIDNFLADERDEMDEDSEEWDVSSEEENKVDDE